MMRIAQIILAAACLNGQHAVLLSQQFPQLTGIDSVRVGVGRGNESARAAGLDSAAIQTKVELELRRSGIPVSQLKSASALLVIETQVIETAGGFAFCVNAALFDSFVQGRRLGKLPGWSEDSLATSWKALDILRWYVTHAASGIVWHSRSIVGTTPRSTASSYIMESIVQSVEEFMNDFLAANPR